MGSLAAIVLMYILIATVHCGRFLCPSKPAALEQCKVSAMKMANAFVQQGFPKFTGDDLFPSLPVYSIHWFSHFKATPSKCWRQMVMLHKFVTCISKSRFIVLFPDVAGCPLQMGSIMGQQSTIINHHIMSSRYAKAIRDNFLQPRNGHPHTSTCFAENRELTWAVATWENWKHQP